MPHSNFVSFMDDGFHVSPGHGKEIDDRDHPGIPQMPDLSEPQDAILQFKYKTESGSGTLFVKVNDVQVTKIAFGESDSEVARVWFETIKGGMGILHQSPKHNKLAMNVGDSGQVLVSDFKIFYHT